VLQTVGALASAAWLDEQDLGTSRVAHWYVEISLATPPPSDAQFDLNIYPEEWGFVLRRGSRVSSIRVTDEPFVHGRDDHKLLAETPELAKLGTLLAQIEARIGARFDRTRAYVRSNLQRATPTVRAWLTRL
jgi:hypothetical protein